MLKRIYLQGFTVVYHYIYIDVSIYIYIRILEFFRSFCIASSGWLIKLIENWKFL